MTSSCFLKQDHHINPEVLNYTMYETKLFLLILWTIQCVTENALEFTCSDDLYKNYTNYYENNPYVIFSSPIFFKQVSKALLIKKIPHARIRKKGKRGIQGIKIDKIEKKTTN